MRVPILLFLFAPHVALEQTIPPRALPLTPSKTPEPDPLLRPVPQLPASLRRVL